ncbi:MAG: tyrosine-type recombinase/integrase [Planctomycetes bacterium]|nr:tyrosine-type recombinase/integrase [Planctomycetota bacterium]
MLKGFRFYDLRHTFASRLVQAGVPIKAVQELLGHGSIVMTMRYSHLAPGDLRRAVELLGVGGRCPQAPLQVVAPTTTQLATRVPPRNSNEGS